MVQSTRGDLVRAYVNAAGLWGCKREDRGSCIELCVRLVYNTFSRVPLLKYWQHSPQEKFDRCRKTSRVLPLHSPIGTNPSCVLNCFFRCMFVHQLRLRRAAIGFQLIWRGYYVRTRYRVREKVRKVGRLMHVASLAAISSSISKAPLSFRYSYGIS